MGGGAQKIHFAKTSTEVITLLLVSDANEDRSAITQMLPPKRWKVTVCSDCHQALPLIRAGKAPLILAERNLPDGSWKQLLSEAQEAARPPVVVVASRYADEHLWAEVLNLGGYDVLLKPFNRSEVTRVLEMAWRHWCAGATVDTAAVSAHYVQH